MSRLPEQSGDRGALQGEPKHVLALDGLRGLAILLVLIRHFGFAVGKDQAWWMQGTAVITNSGYIGVDLFFVLSGFLITGILYRTLDEDHYFRNFYMRRFLRIFPLYYGYLIVLFLLSHPLRIAWNGMLPVFLSYVQNIILVKPYTVLWYYTGQLWSLAVEEQFYIVWPLLIFFIRDRRRLMATALVLSFLSLICRIAMSRHGISGDLIYTLTPCRMDSLLIGSWVGLAARGPAQQWLAKFARPVFLACGLLYLLFSLPGIFSSMHSGNFVPNAAYSIVAMGFASLLAMALNPYSITARLCRLQAMRWLGRYSYGICVIHLALLHLVNGAMVRMHPATGLLRREFAISLMSISLSLCLAWISYTFYEVRFLKLKRHFSYARPPRQPIIAE